MRGPYHAPMTDLRRPSSRTETRVTACPLDCPDRCTLEVTVDPDANRVLEVDGDRRNPLTEGYICSKVRRWPDLVHGADRIARPAKRVGAKGEGRFEEISWDEALDRIVGRLRECRDAGGESILPLSYGGSNGFFSQDTTDARLFRRLGASRLGRTVCAAATGRAAEGLYGKMPGIGYEDYAKARLIVVWGANPSASGIHLMSHIRRAKKSGARLVVIDPRRTPLAAQADRHIAPRPGTDLPLALAVTCWLFANDRADLAFLEKHATGFEELRERAKPWTPERAAAECGIDADEIVAFAREYAEASPAVLRCGWGPERNRNGGSAVAAILALPAIAGKFGIAGGGFTLSNSSGWRIDPERAIGAEEPSTRLVNMNHVGRLLEEADPAIRFLFVYNHNPAMTLPEQNRVLRGLAREDLFTVVFDSVYTDTTRYADVVLPATTFVEHRDLASGYGSYALASVEPVIDPVGEARSNHEVFGELLRRLDLEQEGDAADLDDWLAAMLAPLPRANKIASELRSDGISFPRFGDSPVQFESVFPRTPGGKARLFPEELDREAPHGLYAYQPDPATDAFPLALISPATGRSVNTTLGHLLLGPARLEMHPDDATARDLEDGAAVRVHNDLGEVLCELSTTDRIRPGTVSLPKGLWSRHTRNGATSNALSPDSLTDLGGGACFNDARVQVERAPS